MMKLVQPTYRGGNGRFGAVSFLFLLLLLAVLPAAAQETGAPLPATTPNAANGLEIYASRCANCHGPLGNGDGELAVNLPMPPRAFTDPTFRQTAVPASFYDLIYNGNLAAGMPGFGPEANTRSPLSDAEIWDTVAAVLALATPQEALNQGQALYAASCQACHGAAGLGDGPEAAAPEPLPSLAAPAYWFTRSRDEVVASLTPGSIAEHEYELNEAQLTAVADYARTFSFNTAVVPNLATIDVATISGRVTNATSGGIVGDVDAQLRAFSPTIEQMLTLTGTVGADGTFAFTVQDVAPEWVYIVSVTYEGLNYSSDVGQIPGAVNALELPVTVYDQSTDPAIVRMAQVHVVFDFPSPEILQVTELYVFENVGTAVFVGELGDPDAGVARIEVPAGVQNLNFQRAFSAMDGFIPAPEVISLADSGSFADTVPLRPGRSNASLVVSYFLPYDRGIELSHSLAYAASSVTVILPQVGVSLADAAAWTEQAQQTMGGTYLSYVQRDLPAGATLRLALAGQPDVSSTPLGSRMAAATRSQSTELIVGGIALLLVGLAAVVFARSRLAQQDDAEEDEAEDEQMVVGGGRTAAGRTAAELIQMIAALDEAHQRGELDEEAYQQERAQLKAELKAIWE